MEEDWKPKMGMVFDSFEDAWKFWVECGRKDGFGVRKQYTHKTKDGSIATCRFTCCKEGLRKADKRDYKTVKPRAETRTNCEARLGLKNICGKFVVHDIVEEHNHILHLPETSHMLSSQRKVLDVHCLQIDLADDAGLQQKKSFDLMSKQVGGRTNLGYTRLDQKNYLRKKRQRSLVHGEAGYLLQYFQRKLVENPSFYHAYQLDEEDQITNVFWADARMLIDYEYFGDVVSLDSTYCTNSSNRPLAVFAGFNHHRVAVIFGAALLYDETTESYKWLFESFLEAHKQKKPQTVFTDQDQAMAKALGEIMPETYHGLCTWHLMQNGIKHLGNLMKGESHFLSDFKKCMYGYEDEEQFEDGWRTLLAKYEVLENTWLQRLYTLKEKWASCFMKKTFTLGMRSTQLSESVNAAIKSIINVNMGIIKFFIRFDDVVEEKRYNELRCEYEARQKIPRLKNAYSDILRQMSEIYTPNIFDVFQNEYELFEACSVKSMNVHASPIELVISMGRDLGEWQVSFDLDRKSIYCSCRKFETFGILCCHCLRVFIHFDVKSLPDNYVLKRWTKFARSGVLPSVGRSEVVGEAHLSPSQSYAEICPSLIRIATEACRNPETIILLKKVIGFLDTKLHEFQNKPSSISGVDEFLNKDTLVTNNNGESTQVKGFKKKQGRKSSKRMRGWVERQLSKRKKNGAPSVPQSQQPTCGQVQHEVPNTSAPTWLNDAYNQQSMNNEPTFVQVQHEIPRTSAPSRLNDAYNQQSMNNEPTFGQVQHEVPNTSASSWLNDAYNQLVKGSNDILSDLGVNSFTSLLMAQVDEVHEDITTLTNP